MFETGAKVMFRVLIAMVLTSFLSAACTKITQPITESAQSSVSGVIEDKSRIGVTVGNNNLMVEVVTSPESITKGLGARDEIGSDGMLFFLPERREANFWMNGMRFSLDLVWIDGDTVTGVTKEVPAPVAGQQQLLIYVSPGQVTKVLELPAGDAAARGINVGDQVVVTQR